MGAKILNSDNEEVKNAVLSGEMSINAGYNKIKENKKVEEGRILSFCLTMELGHQSSNLILGLKSLAFLYL